MGLCKKGDYKLGQRWKADFDYCGMLCQGTKVKIDDGLKRLNKLFDSYEDVNYHKESEPLFEAIKHLEKGKKQKAKIKMKEFNKLSKQDLKIIGC